MSRDLENACNIWDVGFLAAPKLRDSRGSFRKVFLGVANSVDPTQSRIEEIFYTESKVGVIRGMHVQVGKSANYRYIFLVAGRIHDVLIDLRPKSPSFGKKFEFLFEAKSDLVLRVPPGVAHGFQSLAKSIIGYATTSHWQSDLDSGVNPLSIDVKWPLDVNQLSERDLALPSFLIWEEYLKQMEMRHES